MVFFAERATEVWDKFVPVAQEIHGPVNVMIFICVTDEAKKIAYKKFDVSRFPSILMFPENVDIHKHKP